MSRCKSLNRSRAAPLCFLLVRGFYTAFLRCVLDGSRRRLRESRFTCCLQRSSAGARPASTSRSYRTGFLRLWTGRDDCGGTRAFPALQPCHPVAGFHGDRTGFDGARGAIRASVCARVRAAGVAGCAAYVAGLPVHYGSGAASLPRISRLFFSARPRAIRCSSARWRRLAQLLSASSSRAAIQGRRSGVRRQGCRINPNQIPDRVRGFVRPQTDSACHASFGAIHGAPLRLSRSTSLSACGRFSRPPVEYRLLYQLLVTRDAGRECAICSVASDESSA